MKLSVTHIYLFGAFVFILALVKYLLLDISILSHGFVVADIILLLFVLGLIFISLKIINIGIEKSEEKDKLRIAKSNELQNQLQEMQQKLKKYEFIVSEEARAQTERELFCSKLTEIVKQGDASTALSKILDLLKEYCEVGAAICYLKHKDDYNSIISFGIDETLNPKSFKDQDGIHSQSVTDNEPIVIKDIPEDYLDIHSATGNSKPRFIYLLPITLSEGKKGLIEVATFKNEHLEEVWNIYMDKHKL